MVNVANPNTKCVKHVRTGAANRKKVMQRRNAKPKGKEARADTTRGARAGLLPTSGPRAALSGKKARKMEKRMAHALRRKMAEEGEVEMKDVEAGEEKEGKKDKEGKEEGMEVDGGIS